jgi:large subunit ribosomal protein L21
MYAVVKIGGRQFRVEQGDSIVVERLSAAEGDKLQLEPLLFRPEGNGDAVFDAGELEKVKVEATVTGHERGPKIRVLKFKPKKGYKRRTGHRSELTRLEIGEIKRLSRKPAGAAKKEPAAKAEPKEPAKKAGTTKTRGAATKEAAAAKAEPKAPAKKAGTTRKPPAKKKETEDGS